jgi:hypothetical protein
MYEEARQEIEIGMVKGGMEDYMLRGECLCTELENEVVR